MYAISSITDKYTTLLSIVSFLNDNCKILNYIEFKENANLFNSPFDLKISDQNIIYHINIINNIKFGFYKFNNGMCIEYKDFKTNKHNIENEKQEFDIENLSDSNKIIDCYYEHIEESYDSTEFKKLISECMDDVMNVVDRKDVMEFAVILVKSAYPYTYHCNSYILVINKNTENIKKIPINYNIIGHSYHYNKNNLYIAIIIKHLEYDCILVKVNHEGDIFVDNFNCGKIISHIDYTGSEICVHENLIMLFKKKINQLCIYDYIEKKIIHECKINIGIPYKFVKFKEINKYVGNLENIYMDDKSKDIEIETNDGIVKAHKVFLENSCNYFKTIFSNQYFETKKLKFDICNLYMKDIIKYIYMNNIEIRSVKQLLTIYTLCDEILYFDLKNKVGNILLKDFCLDLKKKIVKISKIKFLKDLPNFIKVIIFDRNFNESIDGLINENIEKIIFGLNFNQKINMLPKNVKIIELNKYWNHDFGDLPDSIEILYIEEILLKRINKYPKNLKKIIVNISKLNDEKRPPFKLDDIEVLYNYNVMNFNLG
jgi:hypothetical protein